jgi:hypothetical protein
VGSPGQASIIPFVVTTSASTVNGVAVPAGVYMDAAFIKNGTITNAKIGDAQIDNSHITELSADKLTVGDGTVGGDLKSTTFSATAGSEAGWKLQPNGTATFMNAVVRGKVTATSGLIGGNTITSSAVSSPSFATGVSGWALKSDGHVEFGAADIRGQLTAAQIDTRSLTIKNAAGEVIFGSGTALTSAFITADSGWLNSNVTPTTLGVVKIDLTNAPAGIVNSNVTYAGLADAKPPTDADKTSTHTAAGITGQGALATVDNVFVGTTVRFADGTVMAAGDIVSRLSKMGSGNISNFVDGLAITNAYIGNAAISSAKIGDLQVNTVKIGANAVTVPLSVQGLSGLGPFYANGSFDMTAAPDITSPAQWLVTDSVVHVTLIFLCQENSSSWSNCGAGAYMQLLNWTEGSSYVDPIYANSKGTPFFNCSVSVPGGTTTAIVFGGTYTIPHNGTWRIHVNFFNSDASGDFNVNAGYSLLALGAKK